MSDLNVIFAKNLVELRNSKGLTQEQLGDVLGLGKTAVCEWETAKKIPRAGNIEKLAMYFNIPKSALFAEGSDRFIAYGKLLNLPIVGKISCGNGSLAYEEIEGYEPTPEAWLNGGDYFYLRARGDSMNGARIFDGDLVLIRKQPEVDDGQIAAVMVDDNAVLKRVYHRGGSLILQSENSSYPPIIVNPGETECHVIGKLKKVVINY